MSKKKITEINGIKVKEIIPARVYQNKYDFDFLRLSRHQLRFPATTCMSLELKPNDSFFLYVSESKKKNEKFAILSRDKQGLFFVRGGYTKGDKGLHMSYEILKKNLFQMFANNQEKAMGSVVLKIEQIEKDTFKVSLPD